MDPETEQRRLIEALLAQARDRAERDDVEHHETHISHVLLIADRAYKVKKPLNLGFLDCSSLSARQRFCHEEVRLNARLAPQLYLDVVAITGTPSQPVLDGSGEVLEYAVRMRRFDEAGRLDHLLVRGELDAAFIRDLARRVAAFHEAADQDPPKPYYGSLQAVIAPARDNFAHIRPQVDDAMAARLDALAQWTEARFSALAPVFERRRGQGRVRECHGDMHLANIALVDGEPAIFDGIEFNAAMRWTDVAADVAFAVMDLDCRQAPELAGHFLDEWLATTGDYDALVVLPFYWVYRALVRAKIAAIRMGQQTERAQRGPLYADLAGYVALAERYAAADAPAVLVATGVAGCGKSVAAAVLVERIGAIRLRADVERRRLYPDTDPSVRYAASAHEAVYQRLEALVETVVHARFPAVVDATCLERASRRRFIDIGQRLGLPVAILDIAVPEETLRERVAARYEAGADVSEAGTAIMESQLQRFEPLAGDECALRLPVDNGGDEPRVPATGLPHARGLGLDQDAPA